MISDSTLYGISIAGIGLLGLIIRYGFKSKCSDVSCCFGCLKIRRDTEAEIKEEEIDHRINRNQSQRELELKV